jgi:hypothetical protein
MPRSLSIAISVAIVCQLNSSLTLAESKKPKQLDKFPPNPLEITTPDPLLPPLTDKQQLTLLELQSLEKALDELNLKQNSKGEISKEHLLFGTGKHVCGAIWVHWQNWKHYPALLKLPFVKMLWNR